MHKPRYSPEYASFWEGSRALTLSGMKDALFIMILWSSGEQHMRIKYGLFLSRVWM